MKLAAATPAVLLTWTLTAFSPALTHAGQAAAPAAPAAAQSLPTGVERITSVEGITEYRLANGLQVLLFPDQSKQTITVNVTYKVGSRHEGYGETGMAHLLEHLVFKGSPRHRNIPQELTEHGSRPNGSTWFDRTNYFETFAATEDNLRWALDLESDRMVNSFIAKADLDSEMTVVRNELESGENSPTNVLLQRVLSTAYLWHNYGKSTIGSRSDLENVPIDRLQAFYRTYYQPDNAVLLVAGKFDEPKTLELIDAVLRAHPETHTADSDLLHCRANPGWRAQPSPSAALVTCSGCCPHTMCRRVAIPISQPSTSSCRSWEIHHRGVFTKGWLKPNKRARPSAATSSSTIPAPPTSPRRYARSRRSTRLAIRC